MVIATPCPYVQALAVPVLGPSLRPPVPAKDGFLTVIFLLLLALLIPHLSTAVMLTATTVTSFWIEIVTEFSFVPILAVPSLTIPSW